MGRSWVVQSKFGLVLLKGIALSLKARKQGVIPMHFREVCASDNGAQSDSNVIGHSFQYKHYCMLDGESF